ncbi:hypothetical protein OAF54_03745, partial [bacterium]|nr:hypothetical protein [bacterium]
RYPPKYPFDVRLDPPTTGGTMLTVLCVYQPSAVYTPEYVLNLQDAVASHLPAQHQFVCMTELPIPGVPCIKLDKGWPGWWSKMEMFAPDMEKYGRILYIDLDTVITGDISDIAGYDGDAPAIVRDFIHGGPSQSILSYRAEQFDHVWKIFSMAPERWMEDGDKMRPPNFGDQIMMNEVQHPFEFNYWQDLLPGQIISYRLDCKKSNVIDILPDDARMISFHGRDKPHSRTGWVREYWAQHEERAYA